MIQSVSHGSSLPVETAAGTQEPKCPGLLCALVSVSCGLPGLLRGDDAHSVTSPEESRIRANTPANMAHAKASCCVLRLEREKVKVGSCHSYAVLTKANLRAGSGSF